MSTVTTDVINKAGGVQASLSGLSWAWHDEDVGALNAPTDKGSTESIDGSGELIITLSVSALASGQFGTLKLYDPTGVKTGTYRLPVD